MLKIIKNISPVPIDSKFYGQKESDNQIIDLYKKIMIFNKKTMSKWGVGALAQALKYKWFLTAGPAGGAPSTLKPRRILK